MTNPNTDPKRVAAKQLTAFIETAFLSVGMPNTDAALIAKLMADADVGGADGHGVFRLPQYIKRIKTGGINLTPDIRVARERAAMALVDGDNAMGHLVMHRAAHVAVDKARTAGVAWAGSYNSNHAGPARLYATIPLDADMIGIYVAVGNANHLPPWGGTEMLLSTNPIAIAVPAMDEPPIVLDMATTVAAYGKVKTAAQRGEQMPVGWMIDRLGQPLTDPTKADEGFLLPIGGAKGYGLALMFGLLAGTLNGARFGRDLIDFNADFTTPTNTGQFIIAVSIKAFGDPAAFKQAVDAVARDLRTSQTLPGVDAVRLPGDSSHATRRDREANGVPLHPGLWQSLQTLADDLAIAPLAPL